MDSFELNKIAGAILATGLGVMAVSILSEAIYSPSGTEKAGFVIATAETGGTGGATGGSGGAPTVAPIAVRLQTADIKKGEQISHKCMACHTLQKGQPARVGPNLYGVVGSPIIHHNGFSYSAAFKAKGKDGFTWTFAHLDAFLTGPRKYIPGTAMSFAGLPKPADRADVIAYLRTLSDNPVPLPKPPAQAPAAGGSSSAAAPAAPAGGGASSTSFAEMVKSADIKKGEQISHKCMACHTLQKGQPTRVGPNLYDVVGTPIIRPETGYSYSSAFQDKGKAGFTWTYDHLNTFLTDPRKDIPGTKMTFAGLKKEQDRADIVAYLRTLSPDPVPLPAGGNAAKAPAAGGSGGAAKSAAPAGGGTSGAAAPAAPAAPAGGQKSGAAAPAAGGATPASFVEMVKNGDIKKGEQEAKKCMACHTLQKGQPTRVGPNLYDVVGTPIIRPETGYGYSSAFKDKGKTGFTWTYDHLNAFLTNPRKDIPGTNMTFAGIKDEQTRADVVAYLRTLSPNPVPLTGGNGAAKAPANGATAPANGSAPAGGGASGSTPATGQ